jgi:hypothetical protein
MLVILIASALVVVVALLGLSICRAAALSDRNSDLALTEWLAARHLDDRQAVPADRSSTRLFFDSPGEAFRAGDPFRAAGRR